MRGDGRRPVPTPAHPVTPPGRNLAREQGRPLGTAAWAHPEDIARTYPYKAGAFWLGRSLTNAGEPVGYRDDRHICLVSGNRGGKGTSTIIPNLCMYPGSIVVVDPKGENATVTASRRGRGSSNCRGLGQTVHVLDPFRTARIDDSLRSRFNPLDALDPEDEGVIDEVARLAAAIIVPEQTNDPFWETSARTLLQGLILHVLTYPKYEGRRTLLTVRQLLLSGDWELVAEGEAAGHESESGHDLLWEAMRENPAFEGLVAAIGTRFRDQARGASKQFEGILEYANMSTRFLDSPGLRRCLATSDFKLSDLKTDRRGVSLYLSLPQRYMTEHFRWLRMMISLIVTEMEATPGQPTSGHPILVCLDEFAGLKRMEIIETAVAQLAGFGVRLFFVLQSLEQLKATYKDNWETFLANAGLKIFHGVDDHFSREYISKYIGETEVIRLVHGQSDSTGTTQSESESETKGNSTSVTKSTGRNWGESWTPWFFGLLRSNLTKTLGGNSSVAHMTGENYSQTRGTSWGTSQTQGTSINETVHRRALISPDEIGRSLARIDDRKHLVYPGLGLVLISGQNPALVRKINYYEDPLFVQCFDPHPDYPLPVLPKGAASRPASLPPAPRLWLTLDQELLDWIYGQDAKRKKSRPACLLPPRDAVRQGQPLIKLVDVPPVFGTPALPHVKAPVAGTIVDRDQEAGAVSLAVGDTTQQPHFDRLSAQGGLPVDEVQPLGEYCRLLRKTRYREAWIFGLLAVVAVIGLCAASIGYIIDGPCCLALGVGLGSLAARRYGHSHSRREMRRLAFFSLAAVVAFFSCFGRSSDIAVLTCLVLAFWLVRTALRTFRLALRFPKGMAIKLTAFRSPEPQSQLETAFRLPDDINLLTYSY